jgi:2-polyprenyl-3-methyl-5-hydroxy-6-metoxy-1,4-benzoquinol methylase
LQEAKMRKNNSQDRDFRERYFLPIQWMVDESSHFGIDYNGYISAVLSLLPKELVHVLDVGCGPGYLTEKILKLGHKVIGIDYSDRAIAFSKIFVPEAQFNVIDIRELNNHKEFFNRFDFAVFVEVLEHLPVEYHEKVLSSLNKCLKNNGKMIITVPSVKFPLESSKWHYKHFTLEEILTLLKKTDFIKEKIIFQHKKSWLYSPNFWRLIQNRFYDLIFVRKILKKIFTKFYNIASSEHDAKRYIILSKKKNI